MTNRVESEARYYTSDNKGIALVEVYSNEFKPPNTYRVSIDIQAQLQLWKPDHLRVAQNKDHATKLGRKNHYIIMDIIIHQSFILISSAQFPNTNVSSHCTAFLRPAFWIQKQNQ